MIKLLYIQNSRSTSSFLENNDVPRGQNIVEHSDSTRPTDAEVLLPHKVIILRLMKNFATRKSSNEYGFSIVVTSLNKIGKERIRDHTDNVILSVTFKYNMLVVVTSLVKGGFEIILMHHV